MKTIKELDEIRERHYFNHFSRGYYQALKDVLGLIDEIKFIPEDTEILNDIVWAEELKARISGT